MPRLLLAIITSSKTELEYLSNITKDIDALVYYISTEDNIRSKDNTVIHLPKFQLESGKDILSRLMFLYTDPEFEFLMSFYHNKYIDSNLINETLDNLAKTNKYINNDKLFATTRNYVALNGFDFKNEFIFSKVDPLEELLNINKAMNGEPVEDKYFVSVLNELLPKFKIKLEFQINDNYLMNYLSSIEYNTSETIYVINDLESFNKEKLNKKDIILYFSETKQDLNHIMAVFRTDGLCAYILRK